MQPQSKLSPIPAILLLLAILALVNQRGCSLPSLPSNKPTSAVYVYEKDQGGVPASVLSGLNRINREKKIVATVFEEDSTDGTETPEQYKAPLAEAKKAGLPAFVVMAGDKAHKVVKAPKTEAEIMEAVQ